MQVVLVQATMTGGGGCRPFIYVDLPMAFHVAIAAKLFQANITEEWLLARVSPLVSLEVAQLGEGLVAGLAFEGLFTTVVSSNSLAYVHFHGRTG